MAQPRSERALRRLVTDLARANSDDVEAILDELSADQQRIVRGLLDAYLGRLVSSPGARQQPAADQIDVAGYSAAIAARLLSQGKGDWRMTEAAVEALCSCARRLPPEPEMLRLPPTTSDRKWPWLSGRRRELGSR